MYRILYVSTPDKDLTITEVEEIVAKSRVNNRNNKITGFLCGSSKFLFSALKVINPISITYLTSFVRINGTTMSLCCIGVPLTVAVLVTGIWVWRFI